MVQAEKIAPLKAVLFRIRRELAANVDSARDLQDHVGDLVQGGGASPQGKASSLQTLDHLTQSLECLEIFVDDILDLVEPSQQVDIAHALSRVFLRDLADRLSTCNIEDKADLDGDVDLF